MRLLKVHTQIHHFHRSHRPILNAARHGQQFVPAVHRIVIRLERRRRRSQQRHGIFELGTHYGHVAAVIARRFFLLVTAFLLLIDNDQPHIFQRRKNRRPRPHNYARLPVAYSPPFTRTLHITQRRMQNRHALEACTKPRATLPSHPQRQRNFRHQYNRGFPARQHVLHTSQIHFGLAAAGHSVQKLYSKFAKLKTRSNRVECPLLLRVQTNAPAVNSRNQTDPPQDQLVPPIHPTTRRGASVQ